MTPAPSDFPQEYIMMLTPTQISKKYFLQKLKLEDNQSG